jgi:hypothetical protein
MHALPNRQAADPAAPPIATFLVRNRIWVYLALLLLALGVIVADQRASEPPSLSTAPAAVASPSRDAKPAPTTQHDRPVSLPDH